MRRDWPTIKMDRVLRAIVIPGRVWKRERARMESIWMLSSWNSFYSDTILSVGTYSIMTPAQTVSGYATLTARTSSILTPSFLTLSIPDSDLFCNSDFYDLICSYFPVLQLRLLGPITFWISLSILFPVLQFRLLGLIPFWIFLLGPLSVLQLGQLGLPFYCSLALKVLSGRGVTRKL